MVAGLCGLVSVRIFEDTLFYDPFLNYFHEANQNIDFPVFEWGRLIGGHLFRFALNLLFSCMIIYGLFKSKEWTIQGAVMMIIVFAIAFPIYLYCINDHFSIGYLFFFLHEAICNSASDHSAYCSDVLLQKADISKIILNFLYS